MKSKYLLQERITSLIQLFSYGFRAETLARPVKMICKNFKKITIYLLIVLHKAILQVLLCFLTCENTGKPCITLGIVCDCARSCICLHTRVCMCTYIQEHIILCFEISVFPMKSFLKCHIKNK